MNFQKQTQKGHQVNMVIKHHKRSRNNKHEREHAARFSCMERVPHVPFISVILTRLLSATDRSLWKMKRHLISGSVVVNGWTEWRRSTKVIELWIFARRVCTNVCNFPCHWLWWDWIWRPGFVVLLIDLQTSVFKFRRAWFALWSSVSPN